MATRQKGIVQALRSSMVPNEVSSRYEEWVVDYRQCTLESLEKDFEANVNWGKCQQVVVCVDMTRALIAPIPTEHIPQHVIDWDGVEITPIAETRIGHEDERAARLEAEKQLDSAPSPVAGHAQEDLDNETDIGVTDVVSDESKVFYDSNDPTRKT
uniref:Uncharacterized protein n=1 Tax=Oryza nivara TaxID=4536 RepID=A0A0E0J007_ORYNI